MQLRNVGANLCVDTKYRNGNERFGLEACTKDNPGLGGEQVHIDMEIVVSLVSLSVCLSLSLSVCLSVCLSVYSVVCIVL